MVAIQQPTILIVRAGSEYARVRVILHGSRRMALRSRIEAIDCFKAYPQLIDDLGDDQIATVDGEQACDKDAIVFQIVQNEVTRQLSFFLRMKGGHDAEMSSNEVHFFV